MDKLKHIFYFICKECYLSIVLVKGKCRRYYIEKILPNKFSADNNIDLEEVSEEFQELTEIEKMLILKVFTVISIYRLHGKQNGYRGNIINFFQNI